MRVERQPNSKRGSTTLLVITCAFVGASLLAIGFAGGYLLTGVPRAGAAVPGTAREPIQPASPEALLNLPAGNLVLVDVLGSRLYGLATRPNAPASEALDLRAYRIGTDGRLSDAGRFRFNPATSELTDNGGQTYPVEWDESHAALRVVRGGTLTINTRPVGATVSVNGRKVGPAPVKLSLAAGKHRIRVAGAKWTSESEIDLPAGRAVSVTLGPQ